MSPDNFYTEYQPTVDFLAPFLTKIKAGGASSALPCEQLARLASDTDFIRLTEAFRKPNPFTVMGRLTDEVRHSNFLAYLLTPWESHGLGLDVLFALAPVFRGTSSEPASDARDIIVFREHVADEFSNDHIETLAVGSKKGKPGRPDVIVYDPVLRRAAIIELKVKSDQGKNQLGRYRQWATEYFSRYHGDGAAWRCNLIYLTNLPCTDGLVQGGHLNAIAHEIPVNSTYRSDIDDNAVWTMANYGCMTEVLEPFARDRANSSGAALISDYLAFLGQHICPQAGTFAATARRLATEYADALIALKEVSRVLRQNVLSQLQPDFATLGLSLAAFREGAFNGKPYDVVKLDYLRDENDRPTGWPDDADELEWDMSLFKSSPGTSICAKLKVPNLEKRRTWSKRFGYRTTGTSPERALAVQMPLPIQQTPYPLTRDNMPLLVEYLRMRLRSKVKSHIDRVRQEQVR